MFFEFNQNNPGGCFITNDKVCHRLFIEADDYREAIWKAEDLGCYWNGVNKGIDCSCCGDRWYEPHGETEVPTSYSVGGYGYSTLEEWMNAFGKYSIVESPKVETNMLGRFFKGKISFKDIEEYAQFLANEYGWTTPDIRIYYKNGTVKEIFTEESN